MSRSPSPPITAPSRSSQSLCITVTPFHCILSQTPHPSLVSFIREFNHQHYPGHLISVPFLRPRCPTLTIPIAHPQASHMLYFLYFVVLACWCFDFRKMVKYQTTPSIKSYRFENVCFGMKLNSGAFLSLMLHLVLKRVLCHLCHTFIWQAWGWHMRRSTWKWERREIELVSHCP